VDELHLHRTWVGWFCGWDDFVEANDIPVCDIFIFNYTVNWTLKGAILWYNGCGKIQNTISRDHPEITFYPSVHQSMLLLKFYICNISSVLPFKTTNWWSIGSTSYYYQTEFLFLSNNRLFTLSSRSASYTHYVSVCTMRFCYQLYLKAHHPNNKKHTISINSNGFPKLYHIVDAACRRALPLLVYLTYEQVQELG
jgi:hypothetical protein